MGGAEKRMAHQPQLSCDPVRGLALVADAVQMARVRSRAVPVGIPGGVQVAEAGLAGHLQVVVIEITLRPAQMPGRFAKSCMQCGL